VSAGERAGAASPERRPVRHVLVLDPEPQIPRLVGLLLGPGYLVDGVADGEQALARLHATPYDVVVSELVLADDLSGETALQLLRRLRRQVPDVGLVAFTTLPTVSTIVGAMRAGAFDVVRKTAGGGELRAALDRAVAHGDLAREVRRLRSEVEAARGLGALVGESAPMRALLAMIERVAGSDATVLIVGESGTGKELIARTIHRIGPRAERPFVAFDCSALTPSLLEAELFGHEKGAFTGAGKARRGLFREAHGGTIFLDEIGDIAPSVQNKLLRVLQERELKPVGGDHFVSIDVRVVAATNKDLRALVQHGAFREDLYWRLAVVPIQVPPLRERREDIPLLAAHILARRGGAAKTFAGGQARYPSQVTPAALARLAAYHWPGNIRELENVLSRAAILCDGEKIRSDDLDLVGLPDGHGHGHGHGHGGRADGRAGPGRADAPVLAPGQTLRQLVEHATRQVEQAALAAALEQEGGSPSRAARVLGISRASVYNKLKEYGLTIPSGPGLGAPGGHGAGEEP
jgi:two-component system response regulator HydG